MSNEGHQVESRPSDIADITWDERYDDPDAKVILVSEDNVGFRVHAWAFKKKSGFIRDLLDVSSQHLLDSAPIHLDYPSTVIRHFVQQFYTDTIIQIELLRDLTFETCKGLFELCDRFEAPQIYDVISRTACTGMSSNFFLARDLDVWQVFRLAAHRDDFLLAKAAIAALDHAGLTEEIIFATDTKSYIRFDDLPMRYVYPLLMLRYKKTNRCDKSATHIQEEEVWIKRDSKSIAAVYELA